MALSPRVTGRVIAAAILGIFGATGAGTGNAAQPPLNFYGNQCSSCDAPVRQPDGSYYVNCATPGSYYKQNNWIRADALISEVMVNGNPTSCTTNAPPPWPSCGQVPPNPGPQSWIAADNVNGTFSNVSCNLSPQAVIQAQLDAGTSPFQLLKEDPDNRQWLLGARWQGGILINIESTGRGLLAAPADISGQWFMTGFNTAYWAPFFAPPKRTGATDNGLYLGAGNTQTIINKLGAPTGQGPAAYSYAAYSAWQANQQWYLGYNDWYLPTVAEAAVMIQYAVGTGSAQCTDPMAGSTLYWTATEDNKTTAVGVDCRYSQVQSQIPKNSPARVRLVRQFTEAEPQVTTTMVTTNSGAAQLTVTGTVVANGALIRDRGVCYNTVGLGGPSDYCVATDPNLPLDRISVTLSTTPLLAGTPYYFRAYATTTVNGTYYGATVSATMPGTPPPVRSPQQRLNDGDSPFTIVRSDPTSRQRLLGATFLDGILIDLDMINGRGLIVAPDVAPDLLPWANPQQGPPVTTNATGEALYDGDANTTQIINRQGPTPGYAAAYAAQANNSGYLDYKGWYLPDADEAVAMMTLGTGGSGASCNAAPDYLYWTSTEIDQHYAVAINCHTRQLISTNYQAQKLISHAVRLVRKFTDDLPQLVTAKPFYASGGIQVSATLTASGATIRQTGFCYATSEYPVYSAQGNCVTATLNGNQLGASIPAQGLDVDSDYFIRAYAITDNGNVYGNSEPVLIPGDSACTASITNTFSNLVSPYVMAVNSAGNRIYVSQSGKPTRLVIIDGNSKQVVANIATDAAVVSVAVDETRALLYYTVLGKKYVYVADALTGAAIGSAYLGQLTGNSLLAVAPDSGAVYAADKISAVVYKLTSRTLASEPPKKLAERIAQIVYATSAAKLFIGHQQTGSNPAPKYLTVLDANLNKSGTGQVTGVNYVADMSYDAGANQVYVSTSNNALTINAATQVMTGATQVSISSREIRFNPVNSKLYVGVDAHAMIWLVNVLPDGTTTQGGSLSVGSGSKRIAVSPRSGKVYVTAANANKLYVFNHNSTSVLSSVSLPTSPTTLEINRKTGLVYAGSYSGNAVYEVSCK